MVNKGEALLSLANSINIKGNRLPSPTEKISLKGVRTPQLVDKLSIVLKVPELKVNSTDPSDPARMELTIGNLPSIYLENFPSKENKINHAKARLAVLSAVVVAAVRKYNLVENEAVGMNSEVLREVEKIDLPSGSETFSLIELLPQDEKELTQLIKDAQISPRSNWVLRLSTAGVTIALLAGCAKMNLTDRAMAAPVASATPTTEVTPPPTLTAPTIEPTQKLFPQPTQWLPTSRAVEPTAKPTEKPAVVDFSIKYPKKWSKEFVGTEEGLKVPLTAIIDNSVAVAKEIGMTQPANDGLIEFFLKASYYRYKTENHLTLTYDQYLEQVKLGKVGVPIIARGTVAGDDQLKERTFDPGLGIDIILSSRKLPILWNNVDKQEQRYDFQVDSEGKLTIVTELSQTVLDRYKNEAFRPEVVDVIIVRDLLVGSIHLIPKALFFDTCIKAENIPLACKNPMMRAYPDFREDSDEVRQLVKSFDLDKSQEAPFTIVR